MSPPTRTGALALALLAVLAPHAGAQMPAQSQLDVQWALLSGGVAQRPYVSSLTRLPAGGGAAVPIWSSLASATASPPPGYESGSSGALTALVTATNMCAQGQTPAHGVCYNPPNRVAVTLALTAGAGSANPDLTGVLTTGDVIEVQMVMGSAFSGDNMQWSWANGNVSLWRVSTAGGLTTVTVRLAPVATPVPDWSSVNMASQCCTCDMPSNCPLARASAFTLGANFFIQIRESGAPASPLAGAIFATTNAVMGGLEIGSGGSGSSSLDYAFASAHLAPDGSLLTGTLNAFVPSATIGALFGGISAAEAATALNVTRTGDPGTQASVALAPVTAAAFGGDGLMVTVTGVTFSAPTYQVALAAGTPSGGIATAVVAPLLLLAAAAAALL